MVQLRRLEVVGLVDRVDDEDTRKLAKGMLEVAPNFQVDHAALWWVPVESIEAVVIAAHTHDVAYGDLWWLNGVKRVVVCGKQITESGKEKSIDVEEFDMFPETTGVCSYSHTSILFGALRRLRFCVVGLLSEASAFTATSKIPFNVQEFNVVSCCLATKASTVALGMARSCPWTLSMLVPSHIFAHIVSISQ